MEIALMQEFAKYGVAILTLFFMLRYFMATVREKDEQNQANLERFITIQKETVLSNAESNRVHAQTAAILAQVSTQMTQMDQYMRD